jgi:hypothetical protein
MAAEARFSATARWVLGSVIRLHEVQYVRRLNIRLQVINRCPYEEASRHGRGSHVPVLVSQRGLVLHELYVQPDEWPEITLAP